MNERFPCYLVRRGEDGVVRANVEPMSVDDLPPGDVLLRVEYSSLNYKDALAVRGHQGIVKRLPHVPGIDAAGQVVASSSSRFAEGDLALVTGYGMGAAHWGGFSRYVRIPESWVVPLPDGLTLREAMILGTAGFTAAQAVQSIVSRPIDVARGDVVVTGATGGVGTLAVTLLATEGYRVVAVTGKPEKAGLLEQLGAARVIGRDELLDESDRPMVAARWSAAVDTVGGRMLSSLLKSLQHRGCVAACGLVGGTELPMTVYPFLLRGVALLGIDSAMCPMPERLAIWAKLAGPWKPADLERLADDIDLSQVEEHVQRILDGRVTGRIVVRPTQK